MTVEEFWEEFLNEDDKKAVRCKTKEEAKSFCEMMYDHGMDWSPKEYSKDNYYWDIHKENTCYSNSDGYAGYEFYENNNCKIYEYSEIFGDTTNQERSNEMSVDEFWKKFLNEDNKIAIHCKTFDEAIKFWKMMDSKGLGWESEEYRIKNYFLNMQGKDAYYDYEGCQYDSCNCYIKDGYTIYEYSDIFGNINQTNQTNQSDKQNDTYYVVKLKDDFNQHYPIKYTTIDKVFIGKIVNQTATHIYFELFDTDGLVIVPINQIDFLAPCKDIYEFKG